MHTLEALVSLVNVVVVKVFKENKKVVISEIPIFADCSQSYQMYEQMYETKQTAKQKCIFVQATSIPSTYNDSVGSFALRIRGEPKNFSRWLIKFQIVIESLD